MKPSGSLSDDEMDVIWDRLIEVVFSARSKSELSALVVSTLGKEERIMMAKRMMIGILILSGWNSYQISDVLRVSRATVYKYKSIIDVNPLYRDILKDLVKKSLPKPVSKVKTRESYLIKMIELIFEGRQQRSKLAYTQID